MGCCASTSKLNAVDDSVHVMVKHDKKVAKQHGKEAGGYVPRKPHPMLSSNNDNNNADANDNVNSAEATQDGKSGEPSSLNDMEPADIKAEEEEKEGEEATKKPSKSAIQIEEP